MKQTNPLETALRLLIIGVFVVTTLLSLASCGNKSPMEDHIQYIIEKHNDHCQYEIGECPQPECSHYHTN